jgi:hypothetical protein
MSLKGKRNAYSCLQCGLTTITVDEDDGTTPFMVGCLVSKGCDGMMQSHFYRGSVVESSAPASFAWRKPSKEEYRKSSKAMRQHFDLGGLYVYALPPFDIHHEGEQ